MVVLYVPDELFWDLKDYLLQYRDDVESQFPQNIVIKQGFWLTPEELKADITQLYTDFTIEGVILIGDLPYITWEFPWGETCPLPYFYE